MSYCILIPTINRKDLLMEALDWYIPNLKETEIIVLDNGKQGIASGAPSTASPAILNNPRKFCPCWHDEIVRAAHRHQEFPAAVDHCVEQAI